MPIEVTVLVTIWNNIYLSNNLKRMHCLVSTYFGLSGFPSISNFIVVREDSLNDLNLLEFLRLVLWSNMSPLGVCFKLWFSFHIPLCVLCGYFLCDYHHNNMKHLTQQD